MQTMKNQFALLEDFLRCFCIIASEASLRFEKKWDFFELFSNIIVCCIHAAKRPIMY